MHGSVAVGIVLNIIYSRTNPEKYCIVPAYSIRLIYKNSSREHISVCKLQQENILFSSVRFRLRNWFIQNLLELMAFQRMLTIIRDEIVQTVKQFVLYEIKPRLASFSARFDTAMTNDALAPVNYNKDIVNIQ